MTATEQQQVEQFAQAANTPDLLEVVQPTPLGPPRLGLLASIEVINDPNMRFGVKFTPEPCGGEGGAFDPTCGATVNVGGDKSTVVHEEDWVSFGVFEPESCSTYGFEAIDVRQRAERALVLDESKQVEKELWTGTVTKAQASPNRYLTRNAAGPSGFPPVVTQLNSGTATPCVRALADLEYAIAQSRSGGRGMIHCSPLTATYWVREQLLYRAGNLLLTHARDTIVVPGEGYSGSAPGDVAMAADHNSAWAYATGLIRGRRGPVDTIEPWSPELTSQNLRTAVARAMWALEVDPCVYVGINVLHSTA